MKKMGNICIFEDEHYSNFLPLVYTRPVYELICGCTTLREKIERCFPRAKVSLHCRGELARVLKNYKAGYDINRIAGEDCLFINGRTLPGEKFGVILSKTGNSEAAFFKNKELAAIRLKGKRLKKAKAVLQKEPVKLFSQLKEFISELPKVKLDDENTLVNYLWELIFQNPDWIKKDAEKLVKLGKCLSGLPPGAYLINKKNIFIGRGVKISPGVVINAEGGPVIIENKVKIFPQATIIGPVYIGEGSILKAGAQIYEGTTIGKVCKVGGEVEESIFHDFTNKQHHGFIGHTYLGSWINLGAGTTNSDLKNNYTPVKVKIKDKFIDTGLTFAGLFMGDHSKSGINSIFNTGTVVGLGCNLFGSNFLPKFVPSFSWGGKNELCTYKLEKFFEMAKRVMARRNKKLSIAEKKLIEKIFNLTENERKK